VLLHNGRGGQQSFFHIACMSHVHKNPELLCDLFAAMLLQLGKKIDKNPNAQGHPRLGEQR